LRSADFSGGNLTPGKVPDSINASAHFHVQQLADTGRRAAIDEVEKGDGIWQ
jgi:hypothetical protein